MLYFSSTSVHQHMGAHVDHHTRVSLMQQICCTAVQFSAQQFSSLVHSSSVQQYIRSSTWAIRWCCTVLQFRACRSAHEGIAHGICMQRICKTALQFSAQQFSTAVHSHGQYISTVQHLESCAVQHISRLCIGASGLCCIQIEISFTRVSLMFISACKNRSHHMVH